MNKEGKVDNLLVVKNDSLMLCERDLITKDITVNSAITIKFYEPKGCTSKCRKESLRIMLAFGYKAQVDTCAIFSLIIFLKTAFRRAPNQRDYLPYFSELWMLRKEFGDIGLVKTAISL